MNGLFRYIPIGLGLIIFGGCEGIGSFEVIEPAGTDEETSTVYTVEEIGRKAVEAFGIFYSDEGGEASNAYQRDYLYYGLTPENLTGAFDSSVNEYLGFIEVEPNAYYGMSDKSGGDESEDPIITSATVCSEGKELTDEELFDRMWNKGLYRFRFEVITAASERPTVVTVELRPDQLWDFHIKKEVANLGNGRRKYRYTINPDRFTKKRVNLNNGNISLGAWNLKDESLQRYIRIFEEDGGVAESLSTEFDWRMLNRCQIDGEYKLGIGDLDAEVYPGDLRNQPKESKKTSVTMTSYSEDDNLGAKTIDFYDPMISEKTDEGYVAHKYNTGVVTFGIFVR